MNATPLCPISAEGDVVHRYVAGTLSPRELEEFEAHLLGCPACEAAVREGAAIRAAFRAGVAARHPIRWLTWAAPAAAAAGIAIWVLARPPDPLVRLGRVQEAPRFEGLLVRGERDSAVALADSGMAAYARADYREAATLLGASAQLDPTSGVNFFLGISRLMTGDAEGAVAALRASLEPPENPYASEARFYLAKAWLRLGAGDSALAYLAGAAALGDVVGRRASALADSVREALR